MEILRDGGDVGVPNFISSLSTTLEGMGSSLGSTTSWAGVRGLEAPCNDSGGNSTVFRGMFGSPALA